MNINVFENHKYAGEFGTEFWTARDLAKILGYTDYRNFLKVIKKAQTSCKRAGQKVSNHFVDFNDMIQMGKGAKRQVKNIKLSRYACYLIVQNADPSKEIVAYGQSYFAIQTRKQEARENILEVQKRIELRDEIKEHNKSLFKTARKVGVQDFADFYDAGYQGMYGLRKRQVNIKKGLNEKDNTLDYMSSEELAANLFRATQAESKLKRESPRGQEKANTAHREVGQEVRGAIKKIGGTMPENLPAAEHIKEAEKKLENLQDGKPTTIMDEDKRLKEKDFTNPNIFDIPNDVKSLERLREIISDNKGKIQLQIGEYYFKVNDEGLVMIKDILIPV